MQEDDETVTISLSSGGDYVLGSVISQTDTIKNDDHSAPAITANGVTASGPITVCNGSKLTLSVSDIIDGELVYSYYWSNGTSDQSVTVTASGTYSVTVYTADGFAGVSTPLEIKVTASGSPAIGSDTTIYQSCFGDTTNLLTLYNTSGLTATWNTLTPGSAVAGTYRLVVSNAAGCTDTAVIKLVLEVAKWNGNVSTNWHTAANWSTGKIPTSVTHVIIPADTAFNCVISTANAQAASVQLLYGANLQAISNRTLSINGKCLALPNLPN